MHYELGWIDEEASFEAVDGIHHGVIKDDVISLGMSEVTKLKSIPPYVLDTGSPHHVCMVDDLESFDVFSEGRRLRTEQYGKAGANINFVEQINASTFKVRTHERVLRMKLYPVVPV